MDFIQMFESNVSEFSKVFLTYPWTERGFYTNWLSQHYHLACHTPRFLGLSIGLFGPDQEAFHRRSTEHLREETGHHEFARRDLKQLEVEVEKIEMIPETLAIYQSQYYYIMLKGPIAHYGYAYLLEGVSATVGNRLTEIISECYGPKAATFLKLHAGVDQLHYRKALEMLKDLGSQEQAVIRENMNLTICMYKALLEHVLRISYQDTRTAA